MSDREHALARWSEVAAQLSWERSWDVLFDDETPPGRWFVGGRLNAAVNCLNRHLPERADAIAVRWEGEPGDRRTLSYQALYEEVELLAAALWRLGVRQGDCVALFMGAIPELVVSMLACARLGAAHSVVPVPAPVEAVADRLQSLRPRVIITQDGAWRKGREIPLKRHADEAVTTIGEKAAEWQIVIRRTGCEVDWYEGDIWYDELLAEPASSVAAALAAVDADHPLLVDFVAHQLHRPVTVTHRTAGLLVSAAECHGRALTRADDDVFWCAFEPNKTAPLVHGIYGPLLCGASTLLVEGTMDTPSHTRWWEIIERHQVNAMFTLAHAARQARIWAEEEHIRWRLPSLRLMVTSGTALDEATAAWISSGFGAPDLQLVDAWGQTETSGVVIVRPSPRRDEPLPDPGLAILDGQGHPVEGDGPGELVLRNPWPGTFVHVEGHADPQARFWRYWTQMPGTYATGDRARWRPDGTVEFLGRIDPTVKIHGQLVILTDIEDILSEHPSVIDALAASTVDSDGEPELIAWVVLERDVDPSLETASDLRRYVFESLGGLARPSRIGFAEGFPEQFPRRSLRLVLGSLSQGTTEPTLHLPVTEFEKALAQHHGVSPDEV
jgi:acetyl-CoA synthetase